MPGADLHDGGPPPLHGGGGLRHPAAGGEAAGHPVHGRGGAGPLGPGAAVPEAQQGHPAVCESVLSPG